MSNFKLPKELKKRMERELRQYWYNMKKLESLEQEIIDESNSGGDSQKTNSTSDPTSQKAIKLLSTRSIAYLSERILYVTRVIERLKPWEKDIFYLIFRDGKDWVYCEANKGISKSAYYNLMNKAIYYLAEEFGEI